MSDGKVCRWFFRTALLFLTAAMVAINAEEGGQVAVKVVEYPGNFKPDGMWAGLYAAASGKVYSDRKSVV